jgi:hypothetical protein
MLRWSLMPRKSWQKVKPKKLPEAAVLDLYESNSTEYTKC